MSSRNSRVSKHGKPFILGTHTLLAFDVKKTYINIVLAFHLVSFVLTKMGISEHAKNCMCVRENSVLLSNTSANQFEGLPKDSSQTGTNYRGGSLRLTSEGYGAEVILKCNLSSLILRCDYLVAFLKIGQSLNMTFYYTIWY